MFRPAEDPDCGLLDLIGYVSPCVTLGYSRVRMSVSIQHQEQPGRNAAVVTVIGRLLLGPGCVELERVVTDLLDQGYRYLTFNIAGVTHIDSTGMGRFIDAYNKLTPLGGSIQVAGAKGAVREMFRVTRLDTVFQLD